ncbi:MAG: EamA family transporter, partial [Proteobacteria bacterium]
MSSPASPLGGFLIGLAAFGWAADTLFRYPLMQAGFDPVLLVCIDHAICLVFLLPYFWIRHRGQLTSLSRSQWLGLFVIGAGASGIATVLFTASFALVNPSVAILIQKLQPVFVIFFAFLFLKERPSRSFYLWAPIALLSGLVISFSDFNFHFVRDLNPQSKGALYAFSAALIWALGTVIGKRVVGQISPGIVTYWRFQFGLLTLVVLYFAGRGSLTSFEI